MVSPGTNVKIEIKPQLFEVTEEAKRRFSSVENKCIFNNDEKSWPHNNEFVLTSSLMTKKQAGLPAQTEEFPLVQEEHRLLVEEKLV